MLHVIDLLFAYLVPQRPAFDPLECLIPEKIRSRFKAALFIAVAVLSSQTGNDISLHWRRTTVPANEVVDELPNGPIQFAGEWSAHASQPAPDRPARAPPMMLSSRGRRPAQRVNSRLGSTEFGLVP